MRYTIPNFPPVAVPTAPWVKCDGRSHPASFFFASLHMEKEEEKREKEKEERKEEKDRRGAKPRAGL